MALRLTQISPGVHRLHTRYTNWYLLEAGGRLTVLDAGLPGDWRDFSSALSRLRHTPGDIDAVLITHHHPDHAGNAERLRSNGARVFSHPADAPYLRGEKKLSKLAVAPFLWHPWYLRYMLHLLANGVTRTAAVAQLDELADGELLDVPGSPRVLHAPGHTAGSCALFLEDRSLLFSGDALVTLDMTRGRTGPQIIRGPHTEDADLALESLDVLAGTNAETVLPGHGEPWSHGVRSAVDLARQPASSSQQRIGSSTEDAV
jgi:glyoxylase-like metal-dependent hydrolase (beta-lactamase superfamily II)